MSEQMGLFEADLRSWVEVVWREAGPEPRREIVAIVAEMGRCALEEQRKPAKEARPDES